MSGNRYLTSKISKSTRIVIGLNSGTSADGLDIALVRIVGSGEECKVKYIDGRTYKYSKALRNKIIDFAEPDFVDGVSWLQLDTELAEFASAKVKEFIDNSGIDPAKIDLIGSHGQTIRHLPDKINGTLTLQLADPSRIAAGTGILTIGDFRVSDTAAGGQGAPLTPIVNQILFSETHRKNAVLNIGGISNLTFLEYRNNTMAGDCGPGNMVVDYLTRKLFDKDYDRGGNIAAERNPDMKIISTILKRAFFSKRGPKSTGREQFGSEFSEQLHTMCRAKMLEPANIIATASMLTIKAIEKFCRINRIVFDRLLLCGGGARNKYFVINLAKIFPNKEIMPTGDLGFPPDYLEAVSFAILANETLCGNKYNLKNITGSKKEVSLGKICLP